MVRNSRVQTAATTHFNLMIGQDRCGLMVLLGLWTLFIATLTAEDLRWSQLPPLPDHEGFAGMFAGVSGDALIVAGGANFPDRRPWEGGSKTWYGDIWLLEKNASSWRKIGRLPSPLGYGVSVTTGDGMLCIGGSNESGHHDGCFLLQWKEGKLITRTMPKLPQPRANMCGALLGSTVYVAGGIAKPDATKALHSFWSLDLQEPRPAWKELAAWPGKGRMLAVAGVAQGKFFLFSGASLHKGTDGKPEREWLRDAFIFTPDSGWETLPDAPRVSVAAPTPAPTLGAGLFIISGDDGSKTGFKPETGHPGFPKNILRFDAVLRSWTEAGMAPFSRATAPATQWLDAWIIPNGEARPGYRSPEVWRLTHE